MKNIQIIDDAINCSYSVYEVPDEIFFKLFPGPLQDIEFIEDVIERCGKRVAGDLIRHTWKSRKEKSSVVGIHGTLFYGMSHRKIEFPNKREADMDQNGVSKVASANKTSRRPRQR
jgi:hypothetical protein